ncbi:2-oxoglutarate oxidoreductase subunit KorB [Spirochaetota bacterium]|nr:2-oxoglutarate oxidoreductase subunit KorB [Spirochaetota bacterium]
MNHTDAVNRALMKSEVNAHGERRTYQKSDFASAQNVRWCPGCGDYAILSAMQRTCAKVGIPRERQVFISGIGCAARFPYYMNTYGFHTIHGRAPGIATGLALTREDLNIWVITGDGDGLSIGVGHLLHLIRRNLNVNVLLFNNKIYGLTKGQYSPTSEQGKITSSSPFGSLDYPFDAIKLVSAAGASFIARVLDRDLNLMEHVFTAALEHKGTAFIEVYQNCNIFNDGAFHLFTDRTSRSDQAVFLAEGEPLRFGKENNSVITWDGFTIDTATVRPNGKPHDLPNHTVIHDSSRDSLSYDAFYQRLAADEEKPTPFGILKRVVRPTYEEVARHQVTDHFLTEFANTDKRDAWLQKFIAAKN